MWVQNIYLGKRKEATQHEKRQLSFFSIHHRMSACSYFGMESKLIGEEKEETEDGKRKTRRKRRERRGGRGEGVKHTQSPQNVRSNTMFIFWKWLLGQSPPNEK